MSSAQEPETDDVVVIVVDTPPFTAVAKGPAHRRRLRPGEKGGVGIAVVIPSTSSSPPGSSGDPSPSADAGPSSAPTVPVLAARAGKGKKRKAAPPPQIPVHIPPMLLDATGYNMFVIDVFMRIQDQFPSWYHNELVSNLSTVYCPYNWTHLTEEERYVFGQHAMNAGTASLNGETVMAAIIEENLELVDMSEETFAKDIHDILEHEIKVAAAASAQVEEDQEEPIFGSESREESNEQDDE